MATGIKEIGRPMRAFHGGVSAGTAEFI